MTIKRQQHGRTCAVTLHLCGLLMSGAGLAEDIQQPLSPADVVSTKDAGTLYIAAGTGNKVLRYRISSGSVDASIDLPGSASGLALSSSEQRLFVTCAGPESTVLEIELPTMKVSRKFSAGYSTVAPVLSKDELTLYICNRYNNEVAFIDLASGEMVHRIPVLREPVAQARTPDNRFLVVANHIHAGRSDLDVVAASISIIETGCAKLVKNIELPNGSGLLRGVAISPDGKYAGITHLLSRFHLPTTQIERGWINTAALTLVDLDKMERINTVLLDNIDSGAANPWDVEWGPDGDRILVTHAGTHEISVIDASALLAKLARMPLLREPGAKIDYTVASHVAADVPNDLSFLVGLRHRVKLPTGNHGPRALALAGNKAFAVNYFSDTLSTFDISVERPAVDTHPLGPRVEPTIARKGEFYFNDASICFQGWQSCSSCHSSEGRVDGLNWDNLNDGIGNPKNAKSLLLAHQTPPSMALGIRSNAYVSVRAGIKNSLFTVQPEEVAVALDEYLKSISPDPSPYLVQGKLSPAAQRGEKLFFREAIGCAECHKPPLFTDMKFHNVGTRSRYDKPADRFDTPTLVEIWRSAPYLHDGSAATIRDVITTRNAEGEHGNVENLSPSEVDDLVEYVLSL